MADLFGAAIDVKLTKAEKPEALDAIIKKVEDTADKSAKASALLAASAAYIKKGDTTGAVSSAKEALAIYKELGNKPSVLIGMLAVARASIVATAFVEGMQMASEVMRTCKESGDKVGEASALYVLAQACLAKQSPEDAWYYGSAAAKLFKDAKSKVGELSALVTVANGQYGMKDYAKAQKSALDAVSIAGELNDGTKGGYALLVQAKIALAQEEPEEALTATGDAMTRARELGDLKLESAVVDVVIDCHIYKKEPEEVLVQLAMLSDDQRKLGDKKAETETMLRKAQFQLDNGETDNAQKTAEEANQIFTLAGDKVGQGRAVNIIMSCYLAKEDWTEANNRSQTAHDLLFNQDPGDKEAENALLTSIEIMINIALARKDWDTAFNTTMYYVGEFQQKKQKKGEASMLMAIADLNMSFEPAQPIDALQSLVLVPGLFSSIGDMRGEATAKSKMARIYFVQRNGREALKAAEEAVIGFRKVGDALMVATGLQAVAQAHFLMASKGAGNGMEALRAAQEALAIFRSAKDKSSEAGALVLTGHAQLLTRSFGDAGASGRAASALYRDLEDSLGEASAMMVEGGSHLGLGNFEEARKFGKDARDLFQGANDFLGEDSSEDFLNTVKIYEKGERDLSKFVGFGMKGGDDNRKKEVKKKPKELSEDDSLLMSLAKNQMNREIMKQCAVAFENFETRRATAPGTTTGRKKVSEEDDQGQEEFTVAPKKDQVLYQVKWVADAALEPRGAEYAPGGENINPKKVASTVIPLPTMLETPKPMLKVGSSARANKMLEALGKKKGVL
jgi:tetratricopeptide (TPR) repeat protein